MLKFHVHLLSNNVKFGSKKEVEKKLTIVTTPRLPLEPRNDAGLRDEGRSLWPAKGLEALLAAAKGATNSVERDALAEEEEEAEEQLRARKGASTLEEDGKASMGLWSAKLEAAVATTSMAPTLPTSQYL